MRLFLIAGSVMRDSFRQYLRHHRLNWRRTKASPVGQQLIEFAGRICYLSFGKRQSPKGNSEYVRRLITEGHESVLEHVTYSILVDGISRGLSHQLVRHRAGFSFSQLSQQYHDEGSANFVVPNGVDVSDNIAKLWLTSKRTYRLLIRALTASEYGKDLSSKERLRAIRSAARSVLPNATETTLVISGNVRAWRNMIAVRGRILGDMEMREFCVGVFRLLRKEVPDAFVDFEVGRDELGEFVYKI